MTDFYAIEFMVDGFGHDTYVDAICKTMEEVEKYIEEHQSYLAKHPYEIVEGCFGKELDNVWD